MKTREDIEILIKEHLQQVTSVLIRELMRKQDEGGAPEPQQPSIGEQERVTVEQLKGSIADAQKNIMEELESLRNLIGTNVPEEIKSELNNFVNTIKSKLDELLVGA